MVSVKIINVWMMIIFTSNIFILSNNYTLAPISETNKQTDIIHKNTSKIDEFLFTGKTNLNVNDTIFDFFIRPDYDELDELNISHSKLAKEPQWWKKHNFSIIVKLNGLEIGYTDVNRAKTYCYCEYGFEGDTYTGLRSDAISVNSNITAIYRGIGRSLRVLAMHISKDSNDQKFVVFNSRAEYFMKKINFDKIGPGHYEFKYNNNESNFPQFSISSKSDYAKIKYPSINHSS